MASQYHEAPAVIVELEIERRPRVLIRAMTEGQAERAWDWIAANEELARIVAWALELSAEKPAA